MKLIKDILTIAHESGRLANRLALVNLLPKLALIGSDPRHTAMLQYLEYALLVQPHSPDALGQPLGVQLAHPRKVNPPRLLLGLDILGVAFLVVDELPSVKSSTHGSAHQ